MLFWPFTHLTLCQSFLCAPEAWAGLWCPFSAYPLALPGKPDHLRASARVQKAPTSSETLYRCGKGRGIIADTLATKKK
jgi:hypothetical protein